MNVLLQMLGGGAVGAVLLAIITGLFSKRKLSAEATDIITKAASGVVERLEAENARVVARTDQLERRYWVAVRYIRQLRAAVVLYQSADQVPTIPTELEQDI